MGKKKLNTVKVKFVVEVEIQSLDKNLKKSHLVQAIDVDNEIALTETIAPIMLAI